MLFIRQAGTPGARRACFPMPEEPDPSGLAQATAQAAVLGLPGDALVFAAPWPAAVATARAASGREPVVAGALAEADYGAWAGRPFAEVAAADPAGLGAWLTDPRAIPHGGESLAGLGERVAAWMESLRADAARVVAVCDAGPIRAALAHALGLTATGAAAFDVAPLSHTGLAAGHGGWRITYVNRKAAP
ncbi:histidine phosphatase family protein [Microbispora triticiradicis]|uniref:histidine phosphatase family protein n=1 Tax=Microbispora triticiradicis TaxID=2200763 RepID=UPI0027DBC949|nr:histidine phosphatase family protein [Microbispora triticiradicis]MBO4270722.1 histidine phosphatase family protein [Microbispora triticiradicis]